MREPNARRRLINEGEVKHARTRYSSYDFLLVKNNKEDAEYFGMRSNIDEETKKNAKSRYEIGEREL